MRVRGGVSGVLAAALLIAAPASGGAVSTIGTNLNDPFVNTLNCSAFVTGCTASNGTLQPLATRAPGGLVATVDSVVVRWRIKVGAGPVPAALRILSPGSSTTRAGAGTSATVTPAASTTSTFETRLPIKAGDTIGLDSQFPPYGTATGGDLRYAAPAITDGAPAVASSSFANSSLLVNADIEPDRDHDEYGDETQDGCPLDGTTHDPCLLTVAVEGGGRVTGPGIDCPGDCSQGYPGGAAIHLASDPDKGFAAAGYTTDGAAVCLSGGFDACDTTIGKNTTITALFHDHRSPQTKITKGPNPTTTKRKIKIKFRSDERPQKFQCALDKKKFVGFCTSPYKAKVKPGKHVFRVRAVDAVNRVDSTPAKLKFEVLP